MDEHTIKCNTKTRRNKEQVNNIKHIVPPNPKDKQGMPPAESLILLQREIPMAWGTTTYSLTPEINHFLYARETKQLTLKGLNSYLVPDAWCRSPFELSNFILN